ncbi:MAG: hypothetical protein K8R99_01705 [Actinomycetia bacterium]|nr:hypothetical protein [Actinomycetes bacterium]
MSYQMPPSGGPPRSTPIPGQSTPIPGTGPATSSGVPTASAFLGSQGPQPETPAAATPYSYLATRPKERNWGFWIVALLIFVPTAIGVGAAVWGLFAAKDAVDKANDIVDTISVPNFPGSGDSSGDAGVSQLLDGGPAATVAALDAGIPGDPTNFIEIILYPGYAFGTAQDPVQLDHIDRYQWQDGALGAPAPQTNDPDAASKVFTIDAVQWDVIAALAADAPRLAAVEEGEVTHIAITRDVFTEVHDVVVRIYMTGPRGSAFIEATPDGTVIRIV